MAVKKSQAHCGLAFLRTEPLFLIRTQGHGDLLRQNVTVKLCTAGLSNGVLGLSKVVPSYVPAVAPLRFHWKVQKLPEESKRYGALPFVPERGMN